MQIQELYDLANFSHREWLEGFTYPWEALDALEAYLSQFAQETISPPPGVFFENSDKIVFGEGTVIEPGAYIVGPCVLGKGCQVRHGAYLRGNILAGDHVVFGHATEVKGSIFLDGAKAPHFAYVGDSVVGRDVNLGAGVRLANLRLDRKEVVIDGLPTGRKKLGALIGDGAQIGCNAVLNPGTVVAKGVLCRPCQSLHGVIR